MTVGGNILEETPIPLGWEIPQIERLDNSGRS